MLRRRRRLPRAFRAAGRHRDGPPQDAAPGLAPGTAGTATGTAPAAGHSPGAGAGPQPGLPPRPRPGLRQRLADLLELPKDVVLDLPRVIAVGHLQALVQNHRGLVEYTPERVVVALAAGRLVVAGEELRIGQVTAEELTVTGQIRAIEFAP